MKKIIKWISEVLFGFNKEELPEACKKGLWEADHYDKGKVITVENPSNLVWVNPPEAYPSNLFMAPEKEEEIKKVKKEVETELNNHNDKFVENLTKDIAADYVSKSKQIQLDHVKTTIDVEKGKITNIKQEVVKGDKFEIKPRLGTSIDVETGKPLVKERPLKLNEEKADKVKKVRKPRNKKKSQ